MKKEKYISNFSLKLYNLCQRIPFLRKLKVLLYFTDSILLLFIKKPKSNKTKKQEIFVIYNYAFGDGVIWLCSARKLRNIYPKNKYNITLICQKGLQSLYENENIFDEIISFELTKATFDLKTRYKLFKKLREKEYDIVLDPIGVAECTTNVFMSRTLVAKEKISIIDETLDNYMCPKWLYNKIYTKIIRIKQKNLSLIEYYAEFIRGLGLTNFEVKLENIKIKNFKINLPKEYYIVFPSASTLLKRWPIKKYAEIINKIYLKTGLPLLFCGTNNDVDSINELKKLLKNIPFYDIVNKTSLLEFIEVVKRAKFVITNDTSTYHIAVTNQVPVTIITGGYTYDRYVKYDFKNKNRYLKPYIVTSNLKCFNCDNKCKYLKSTDKIWPCLEKITVQDAWKIIDKMIDNIKSEV